MMMMVMIMKNTFSAAALPNGSAVWKCSIQATLLNGRAVFRRMAVQYFSLSAEFQATSAAISGWGSVINLKDSRFQFKLEEENSCAKEQDVWALLNHAVNFRSYLLLVDPSLPLGHVVHSHLFANK
jgi:hypothetical protein